MVLTLLWLITGVGWAGWRLAAGLTARQGGSRSLPERPRPGGWSRGWVDAALLVLVVLTFVSAEGAHNKHLARLLAWQWAGLLVAFLLVRRLAIGEEDQRGLFTALLAGAVALSSQGVHRTTLVPPLEAHFGLGPLSGPTAHPNLFACYLGLLLPGLGGAAILSGRSRLPRWQTGLTVACAVLGGVALCLTHDWAAILASLAAGGVAGLFVWRRSRKSEVQANGGGATQKPEAPANGGDDPSLALQACVSHKGGGRPSLALPARVARTVLVLAGLAVLAGAGVGVFRSGVLGPVPGASATTVEALRECWRTSWKMIEERPWLGVGPGNFGQTYPRFLEPGAEPAQDPHNFALEMWAGSGLFALAALLTALGVFFVRVGRWLWTGAEGREGEGPNPGAPSPPPTPDSASPAEGEESADTPLPWEFYLGGMGGLLLGFVLCAAGRAGEEVLAEGVAAGLRSVVWFATFALLDRIDWSARARTLALTTGVLALLLILSVSGGISLPSLAGPLWVSVALSLNALPPGVPLGSRAGPRTGAVPSLVPGLAVAVLGAVAGIYLLDIFLPTTDSTARRRQAERAGRYFEQDRQREPKEREIKQPLRFIQDRVIAPLEQAAREDPDNARMAVQLANWYFRLWALAPGDESMAVRAIAWARRAQLLNPDGAEGYRTEYGLRLQFAEVLARAAAKEKDRDQAAGLAAQIREQYSMAARALLALLERDPTSALLHYEAADALSRAGARGWRAEARAALELDRESGDPRRNLTDRQRKQLRSWLRASASR